MARIIDFAAPVGQKAGHGHWNDLDMLEVGNGGMTFDEYGLFLCTICRCSFQLLTLTLSNAFLDVEYSQEPSHPRE